MSNHSDGVCQEREREEGTGAFTHCVHERAVEKDAVCCWCGDRFLPQVDIDGDHGRYAPIDAAPASVSDGVEEMFGAAGVAALADAKRAHPPILRGRALENERAEARATPEAKRTRRQRRLLDPLDIEPAVHAALQRRKR